MKKTKLIVVLGATSTGKSDLAVDVAKEFNGEIISADSRQTYTGLDLGSGKITKEEMRGIPHYMLDVEDPRNVFTVARFKKQTVEHIENIASRGKIPILCGGTGLYINAVIDDLKFPAVPPNDRLRNQLEKMNLDELKKKLFNYEQDISNVDLNNKRRIIRAIEIIENLGEIPKIKKSNVYDLFIIGLKLPDEELKERIYKRILIRIDKGMIDEVKDLLEKGVSAERLISLGLEYRYITKYLLDELDYNDFIEKLYVKTCQFAKRQKTWFKKDKRIKWFNPLKDKRKIMKEVQKFLN